MYKAELIEAIAAIADVSRAHALRVLDAQSKLAMKTVNDGEDFPIMGIGKLVYGTKNARIGRNPKTGEKVNVPSHGVMRFKPSAELRQSVK